MFYIRLWDIADRSVLVNLLKEAEIMAVFHYIPLYGCPAGECFGESHGEGRYITKESKRLLHLPLFYNLPPINQRTIITTLLNYFLWYVADRSALVGGDQHAGQDWRRATGR